MTTAILGCGGGTDIDFGCDAFAGPDPSDGNPPVPAPAPTPAPAASNPPCTSDSHLPQTAGQGSVTSYDTWRRIQYTTGNAERAQAAVTAINQAEAAGDLAAAKAIAQQASAERNIARAATQGVTSPGGKVIAGMLEQDRSWAAVLAKYSGGAEANFDTYRRIAAATGRSAKSMVVFTRMSKVLGPLGIVFGAGVASYEVSQACPADRPRVAASEGGAFVGGAVGSTLGMAGGGLVLGLLVSNPAGWMVIGAGVVGAVALGWLGSDLGRSAGSGLFGLFGG